MTTTLSTAAHTLSSLAKRINTAHRECETAARSAVQHALAAGGALIQAKQQVAHGEWGDWLASNCECSERTAQRYLKIAKNWSSIESKTTRASDLSVREAVRLLGDSESIHFKSDSPEWYTPPHIIEGVVSMFGAIDLDPCSNDEAAPNVPANEHYTAATDGLSREWHGCVFLNPPYGREIGDWISKLANEYESGNVPEAIALLPARTDTAWCCRLRKYPRCFVRGRLKFSGSDVSAPFPSMLVYLGPDDGKFANAFAEVGDTFKPVSVEDVSQ